MHDQTASFAPLWRRLAALGYDLLAMTAVVMVTVMLCLLLTASTLDPSAPWYRLTLLAALAAYVLLSWLRGGQTLGMRPWRIRLTDRRGQTPAPAQAVLRFALIAAPLALLMLAPWTGTAIALLLPPLVWLLDLGWAIVDRRRRALRDILSGTELRRSA